MGDNKSSTSRNTANSLDAQMDEMTSRFEVLENKLKSINEYQDIFNFINMNNKTDIDNDNDKVNQIDEDFKTIKDNDPETIKDHFIYGICDKSNLPKVILPFNQTWSSIQPSPIISPKNQLFIPFSTDIFHSDPKKSPQPTNMKSDDELQNNGKTKSNMEFSVSDPVFGDDIPSTWLEMTPIESVSHNDLTDDNVNSLESPPEFVKLKDMESYGGIHNYI